MSNSDYSNSDLDGSNNVDQEGPITNSTGKLVMLGVMSLLLCVSMLMSIFTPLPVAFATVLYGRRKAYILGVICTIVAFTLTPTLGMMYFFCFLISVMIGEIIHRDLAPMRAMIKVGLMFIFFIAALGLASMQANNTTPKDFVVAQLKASVAKIEQQKVKLKGADAQELEMALVKLSQPEKVAEKVIEVLPSYLFVSVFFMLWTNLFLVLRSRRVLIKAKSFAYSEKTLLTFKVPEFFIWIVIPSLVLAIWGEESLGNTSSIVGTTLVYCFGVFYFFQGFGILIRLLDRAGIYGFIRTLLVMFLVVSLHWALALVGLFDMWVDFSRFTEKKSQ
ncbi:YybS family protein [Bacteriovoracaceae bacterium]|nr:YybS family protein [Bacteriovoracaceae bacterium]